LRGKELTNDSVLELEQRRDVPTKYERALWKDASKSIFCYLLGFGTELTLNNFHVFLHQNFAKSMHIADL
jgi:hypothetical protein